MFLKILRTLFILLILFFFAVLYIAYQVITPAADRASEPHRLETARIEPGATVKSVAAMLSKRKLIRSRLCFLLLVKYTGSGSKIKAGEYSFSPSQNMTEILKKLIEGVPRARRMITIPEGWRMEKIARLLEEKGVVDGEEFLRLATKSALSIGELSPGNLEGFLFPDTYDFPEGIQAPEVIKRMKERFEEVVLPMYKSRKGKPSFSLREIVTIASLVEAEAKLAEERPLIAAVYYTRLKRNMKLECDATIQYALGEPKSVLTLSDLVIPSVYNTYIHPGLPPGPIGNPGLDSIKAALFPAKVDYLYYVLNDKAGNGSHCFSRTYGEHLRAIAKYQRK